MKFSGIAQKNITYPISFLFCFLNVRQRPSPEYLDFSILPGARILAEPP